MTSAATTIPAFTVDESFARLKEFVIAATGLSYYRTRDTELADHLTRRFGILSIPDCRSYLRLLEDGCDGDQELDCLIEEMTIGETHFFRHPEMFQALQETILPEVLERNRRQRRLRIWSAGSSIGAEAYSVSILLRRCFGEQIRDWDVSIFGTDINRSYLARAARAKFEPWTLRGTGDDVKAQSFIQQGDAWEVKPEYRQDVSFFYHNLVKHACPSLLHNLTAFDVVMCRNVMIYFGAAVIEAIVENLHRCLVDGGWLLVGHAEHNPETFRRFQARTLAGAIVYQRIDRRNAENEPPTMAPQAAIPTELPATPPHQPDRPIRAASLTHEPPRQLRDDGRRSTAECLAEMTAIRRLADQGKVEAAAARCRRLIRVDKLSPVCRFYQALMFEQLGDHAACEQALRRAIYLDRGYAPAHYYLGLTLLRLSRRDEAVRALRTARRLSSAIEPTRILDDFDGLTAGELNELTRMQLEAVDA